MKEKESEIRFLTEAEVSKIIGRAIQSLRNDRHMRRGVPYHKNGRSVRYALEDVLEYMRSKRIVPEGETQ